MKKTLIIILLVNIFVVFSNEKSDYLMEIYYMQFSVYTFRSLNIDDVVVKKLWLIIMKFQLLLFYLILHIFMRRPKRLKY
jgi:hypothetical protein